MSAEPRMNQKAFSQRDDYDAYLNIRTSLFHFDRFPSQLENESEEKKLNDEVLKQRAINETVQSSPEYSQMVVHERELKEAVQEIYQQVPEELDLDSLLLENGLTHAGLRDAIQQDLRVAAVLNFIAERQPEVTDVDAELFYQLHTDRFAVPEQRIARHILVTINDQFAENRRDTALARISKVRKELIKKPFKFEKFAKSTSECPTAMEGGMLGTIVPGQLYPEIDAVLFDMDKGAISDVVESTLGFHVLKCEEIIPAREVEFDEVKEKVKDALRKRNQRIAQRQWLQQRMSNSANA
jgi:peptidyl-prolyl cis-trans isomerase C